MTKIKFETIPIIFKKVDKSFKSIEIPPKFAPLDKMYEGESLGRVEETTNLPIQPEKAATVPSIDLNRQFLFLTGCAGSGKTFLLTQKNQEDPLYTELCATTGIAAINLNTKTVNSLLKYFDTDSLRDSYIDQRLHWILRNIREEKRTIGIDEGSMLAAEQLDLIFDAINEINEDKNPKKLGLHISGDLLQLPPVKADMIINAKCWPIFEQNTIRLNKIWRQGDVRFIEAINLVRKGDGRNAVALLKECGVHFISKVVDKFDGTTLIGKNDLVDEYNNKRLMEVSSEIISSIPSRKGEQLGEWKTQIPNLMRFKVGAYVMIIANDCPNFSYCNGDCGHIIAYNKTDDAYVIKLKRNDKEVTIKRRVLLNLSRKDPESRHHTKEFTPYVDQFTKKWVIGKVEYHPLRLAYATTIHRSQGLSLDKLQVNINTWNFGLPAMSYVAISRARTANGLYIIGTETALVDKIKTERSVLQYV